METHFEIPINEHELKIFKSLTNSKETGPGQIIHLTKDYIEYTDNYICLQYKPKNKDYAQYIIDQDIDNTVLHHNAIEQIFTDNKDCKTFSYVAIPKERFKTVNYPPIPKAIEAIKETPKANITRLGLNLLEKALTTAKSLYDKRKLTFVDIKTNADEQPIILNFPKTKDANELTIYIAPIKRVTTTERTS